MCPDLRFHHRNRTLFDASFWFNRFVLGQRKVGGYRYKFAPFSGDGRFAEPYLVPHILRRGACFVDVGANTGLWTIPAACYYGAVHSFEPSSRPRSALVQNLRKNHISNVTVHSTALSSSAGEAYLYHYPRSELDSFFPEHLGQHTTGKASMVWMERLDSYNLLPDVVKIDTEGWEVAVLKGAMQTIGRTFPKLVIETHDPGDVDKIQQLVKGYRWTRIERPKQTLLVGTV